MDKPDEDIVTICKGTGIFLAVNNKVFTSNDIDPADATFLGDGCLPGEPDGDWMNYLLPLSSDCGTIVDSGDETSLFITYSNILTGRYQIILYKSFCNPHILILTIIREREYTNLGRALYEFGAE